MVFAKTSKAASRLSEMIRVKSFKKTYLAVVRGILEKKQGNLENYLWKDEALNKSKVVSKEKKGSKLARLSYEVIKEENDLSLVKIELETGRHHQIRVQFSNINHSLYGDQKYGNGPANTQIALWSYQISFRHPVKDQMMELNAMPEGFPMEL